MKKKSIQMVEDTEAETVEAATAVESVSVSDTGALAGNASDDFGTSVDKLAHAVSTVEESFEKAKKTFSEAAKKFIYLGATLPNNALKINTVFDGEFEKICGYLQAEIGLYPIIKELIIPVEDLASAKSSIRIKSLQKQLLKSFERRK